MLLYDGYDAMLVEQLLASVQKCYCEGEILSSLQYVQGKNALSSHVLFGGEETHAVPEVQL